MVLNRAFYLENALMQHRQRIVAEKITVISYGNK